MEHSIGKKVYKWFVADDARSGEKLPLARRHLKRVLSAWDDPTDWDDLSLYGFYCLEASIEAAATARWHENPVDFLGVPWPVLSPP